MKTILKVQKEYIDRQLKLGNSVSIHSPGLTEKDIEALGKYYIIRKEYFGFHNFEHRIK